MCFNIDLEGQTQEVRGQFMLTELSASLVELSTQVPIVGSYDGMLYKNKKLD